MKFVTYEIAKILKELDFNEECITFYIIDEEPSDILFCIDEFDEFSNNNKAFIKHYDYCGCNYEYIACPTIEQTVNWLYENFNYYVSVMPTEDDNKWRFIIYEENRCILTNYSNDNLESAYLKGIKQILHYCKFKRN